MRACLTQRARDRRENAQLIMTRYAIERLLYRLSLSPYRESFVLKGAMLFSLWAATPYRATGDRDLLGPATMRPNVWLRSLANCLSSSPMTDWPSNLPE
jgi:hypothetical protein